MSTADLDRARRDLRVSLSLAWPGSPVREPILTHLAAIDAELTSRPVLLCSCGFATDDSDWLDGHLFEHPGHDERCQRAVPGI
ncbi:MAG: hypothetical protein M3Z75_28055 [Actinomycetota bacterium]|nr:hypothetical protein [Actinomycetota bacterium]